MVPSPPCVPGDLLVHLRRARDHADRHFAEAVSVTDLAAVAGLSKYHFLRSFTRTYGITPAAHAERPRTVWSKAVLVDQPVR